jgi:hypothetical protein
VSGGEWCSVEGSIMEDLAVDGCMSVELAEFEIESFGLLLEGGLG